MDSAQTKGETVKKPTTKKTDKKVKPDKKPTSKKAHNLVDKEMQALFLKDLEEYAGLKAKLGKAQSAMRKFGQTVKSDGFTLRQIKLAHELSTPEGEEAFKLATAKDLMAAAYVGAAIGEQLSMFLEPDREPAVDRSYKEGERASMKGETAKPPYDPTTPQHDSWMKGWSDHQQSLLKGGIKPMDDKPGETAH